MKRNTEIIIQDSIVCASGGSVLGSFFGVVGSIAGAVVGVLIAVVAGLRANAAEEKFEKK